MFVRRLWILASLLLVSAIAHAQDAPPPPNLQAVPTPPDFPRGRISGYVFGDWYDNLAGDPRHAYNASGADSGQANIDGKKVITKGLSGFQIRRLYFQLDNDLTVRVASRFRLEADGKSLNSDGKLGVFVKAAYLQLKSVYPRADLYFGIVPTPTYETIDDVGGYRAIEKSIADFRGLAPSADMGLALKGFLDADHVVGYTAMLANGPGTKPETNLQKRAYFSLPVRWRDLRVEPYVDYENVYGHQDIATYQFLTAYDVWKGNVGYALCQQVKHHPNTPSNDAFGHSFFARVAPIPQLGGFVRLDLWQPDRRLAKRVDQRLWIVGLDWQPVKDVHVMPNLEAMEYVARGGAVVPPHHDVQARMTFYWKFSRPQ